MSDHAASSTPFVVPFDGTALNDALDVQWRLGSQWLAIGSAWAAAWWLMQGEAIKPMLWPQNAPAADVDWPAWMVWHNGTEQLA